jgi:hypothetical protein
MHWFVLLVIGSMSTFAVVLGLVTMITHQK